MYPLTIGCPTGPGADETPIKTMVATMLDS